MSLRRTDNLGRPRRFTDPGKLRNVLGQAYAGHLRPDPHAHDDALARFDNVTVGHAWWHWPENPMGEHLIGVDTISPEATLRPRRDTDGGRAPGCHSG